MSDPDLPDLPSDISSLLDAARDVPRAPAADRRRVAARLALATGLAIPSSTLAGVKLAAFTWVAKVIGVAVLATATFGVAYVSTRPSRPEPVVATSPRRAAITPPPIVQPPIAAAPAVVVPAVVVPAPVAPTPSPVAAAPSPVAVARVDDTSLEQELSFIEQAHADLAHGDVAGARATLARHASRYPRGHLRPEREALRVQCLAVGGDRAAALAARERFHRAFPASMLGAAVDRAVDEMPAP